MGVVFVDTETTGLLPWVHEPWEVGLIDRSGREHRWFLPVDVARADPIALEVGGYHLRHPHGNGYRRSDLGAHDRGLVSVDEFAFDFSLLTHGCHMAGAVVSFDAEMLSRILIRAGRLRSWHYHLIDVEALAAGHIAAGPTSNIGALPDHEANTVARPPWSSDELSAVVGVDPTRFERHTALGDCRWAKAIYDRILGG